MMKKIALMAACCLPLYCFAVTDKEEVPCMQALHKTSPNGEQITEFAKTVVLRTFSYSYYKVDTHFAALKQCFTQSGWKSFNNALTQSGNIASAKKDKLQVKAKVVKPAKILAHTEHGWQVAIPVKVHYANKTHQLNQDLNVQVVVDVEKDKLGVAQLIAEATRSTQTPSPIKPAKKAVMDKPLSKAPSAESNVAPDKQAALPAVNKTPSSKPAVTDTPS